jgi:hypothetical protein
VPATPQDSTPHEGKEGEGDGEHANVAGARHTQGEGEEACSVVEGVQELTKV